MNTSSEEAASAATTRSGAQRLRLASSTLLLFFAVLLWFDAMHSRKEAALDLQRYQEQLQARQASGSGSGNANGAPLPGIPIRDTIGPLALAAYAAAGASMVLGVAALVKDSKRKW
jgi:hypothetical protein